MMRWHLSVPATSANLGPGFDMLGLALDFRLSLRAGPSSAFKLTLRGEGAGTLPGNEDNLLAASYRHACIANGWPVMPLRIEIDNPIPISSGLGSSAAAICIGLALAREVHGKPWDRDRMLEEAIHIEGHADNVAPALLGGLICCEWNAGVFHPRRMPISPHIRILAATPQEQANTKAMRGILPNPQPPGLVEHHRALAYRLLEALAHAKAEGLQISCQDRLHQPHRLARLPKANAIFEIFKNHETLAGAYLSGSGPTIGGWVLGNGDPTKHLAQALRQSGINTTLRLLRLDQDGVRREGTQDLVQPA